MARSPRIDFAGVPQHIIQRCNNRQPCFFAEEDYRHYLGWLRLSAIKYGGRVHAYVLMTNHVHLLATGESKGSLSQLMQSLGRRYVRYVNNTYGRTGTLWEGRYKSSLVDSQRYLMTCYRYIELNPVRASMVSAPGAYRWSSFAHNALGQEDDVLSPHALYSALADSDANRRSAYQRLFPKAMDDVELKAIRDHVNQGKVLGSSEFQDKIELLLGRSVRLSRQGHPKKQR